MQHHLWTADRGSFCQLIWSGLGHSMKLEFPSYNNNNMELKTRSVLLRVIMVPSNEIIHLLLDNKWCKNIYSYVVWCHVRCVWWVVTWYVVYLSWLSTFFTTLSNNDDLWKWGTFFSCDHVPGNVQDQYFLKLCKGFYTLHKTFIPCLCPCMGHKRLQKLFPFPPWKCSDWSNKSWSCPLGSGWGFYAFRIVLNKTSNSGQQYCWLDLRPKPGKLYKIIFKLFKRT